MLNELSALEKALSKNDFPAEIPPLEQILKELRSQRPRSLDELDANTRGKLITSLARVVRQPKPPPEAEAAAPAAEPTAPTEAAPPAEAAPAEGAQAQSASPEAAGPGTVPEAAPPRPVSRAQSFSDALFQVGLIWSLLSEEERAQAAFTASGRSPDAQMLERLKSAPAAKPRTERPERPERPERGAKEPRGRREKRPRGPDREPLPPLPEGADWKDQARLLEERGRTRDAGRLHEKNGSHADAARLFELGGDAKSALRNAALAKDLSMAKRLVSALPPAEAQGVLEKAQAYELLMELYVQGGQYDQVARLYERARQFDQAALAWERAGKLGQARKAYERAKDPAGAQRIAQLEIARLVERGDRLGAAVLLVQGGKKAEAIELLRALPPPKAFRFLEKLKLEEEARTLGEAELKRAQDENKPSAQARWLELLGKRPEAAALWEQVGRPDQAFPLYEQLGDLAKAAALAEAAQHGEAALKLYEKLSDAEGVARARALPARPPKREAPEAEGGAEPSAEPSAESAPEPPPAGQES